MKILGKEAILLHSSSYFIKFRKTCFSISLFHQKKYLSNLQEILKNIENQHFSLIYDLLVLFIHPFILIKLYHL